MANALTYPVTYEVDSQLTDRNRVTGLFRLILAIPHIILVGSPGVLSGAFSFGGRGVGSSFSSFSSSGVLGAVGFIMAFISWFAIVFTGKMPQGLWDFIANIMRWKARSDAYIALLRDEYPPFSFEDPGYGARVGFATPPVERNRVTVFFRIFMIIPHLIVLILVGVAWFVTYVIGWLAIIFTGAYPEGLYRFG